MKGFVNIKRSEFLNVLKRYIFLVILSSIPLILHYTKKFDLKEYPIEKDLYLILFSILIGHIVLNEIIRVFQLSNIEWEIVHEKDKIFMQLRNHGGPFNKIFGHNELQINGAILSINGKHHFGRWVSKPEPITITNVNGEFIPIPDYSKIPENKNVTIPQDISDNLILFWKNTDITPTTYYVINEFEYLPSERYNSNNEVSFPKVIRVFLFTPREIYKIETSLSAS